mmetsp:Transcript_7777/g.13090  ORF Transcript_7777/g.13090 Transcript_7777/m.13090 type:complete len:174 (-) Transcript_7777:76-597(-)
MTQFAFLYPKGSDIILNHSTSLHAPVLGAASLITNTFFNNSNIYSFVLMVCRCRINDANCRGETACIVASINDQTEALRIILEEGGGDVGIMDKNQMTAFLHASFLGFVGVLQILKDNGADINAPNSDGISPAMLTAKHGRIAALGWFEAEGRVKMTDELFQALALSSLNSSK